MNEVLTELDKVYRNFQTGKFDPKKAVPTVSMSIEIELDELIKKKNDLKQHVTVYQYLLNKIATTINKYPYLYAFNDKEVILNESLDINIPVSIDKHVEYIVIRNASNKTVEEIAGEIEKGVSDIKLGKNILTNDLLTLSKLNKPKEILFKIKNFRNPVYFLNKYYGNLPITNFGSFNVINGVAVISQPIVSAIVIGKSYKKLKFLAGETREIDCIMITLSFDHRVVDGAYSGSYLNELKKSIEEI
jgi:pyruvate dehydrogenase E2 component (dihydrolipoamide acetyltransferase)